SAIEPDDDVEADRNARLFAFAPDRIEVRMREALAVDRLRREEDATEPELQATAKLGQRRIDVLERDVSDRHDALAIVRRKIIEPRVVGARVRIREPVIRGIPKNPHRRKDDSRTYA